VAYVFARCKLCTRELTHTTFTQLEKLLAGFEEERLVGRDEAKNVGLCDRPRQGDELAPSEMRLRLGRREVGTLEHVNRKKLNKGLMASTLPRSDPRLPPSALHRHLLSSTVAARSERREKNHLEVIMASVQRTNAMILGGVISVHKTRVLWILRSPAFPTNRAYLLLIVVSDSRGYRVAWPNSADLSCREDL
jgi:hypothetical protein